MRIPVVALGLSLFIPAVAAAQATSHRHTFLPPHQSRLSVDFGVKQALRNLPRRSADCDMVKKHRHGLPPVGTRPVELPVHGSHNLKTPPVTLCPAR